MPRAEMYHGAIGHGPSQPGRRRTRCCAKIYRQETSASPSTLVGNAVDSTQLLQAVADRLNHRPRKALNWRTPAEVFHTALAQ